MIINLRTKVIRFANSSPPPPLCRIYASMNCVSITIDNGLSPVRHHAIIWTNAGFSSIGPLWTFFCKILIKMQNFSFIKMHLKMYSAKCRPFCPGCRDPIIRHFKCAILKIISTSIISLRYFKDKNQLRILVNVQYLLKRRKQIYLVHKTPYLFSCVLFVYMILLTHLQTEWERKSQLQSHGLHRKC